MRPQSCWKSLLGQGHLYRGQSRTPSDLVHTRNSSYKRRRTLFSSRMVVLHGVYARLCRRAPSEVTRYDEDGHSVGDAFVIGIAGACLA